MTNCPTTAPVRFRSVSHAVLAAMIVAALLPAGCAAAEPAPAPVLDAAPAAPPPAPELPAGEGIAPPPVLELLGGDGGSAVPPDSAAALLAACAERMPTDRVILSGTVNMRRPYGVSLLQFAFEADADFGASPPSTVYETKDGDGRTALRVRATRDPARGLVLERLDGGGPAPQPGDAIEGTDVTWFDVGFDFLWWRAAALAGTAREKGRLCDLLDVVPPSPVPGCAKVRLWVDREQKVVFRASQFDNQGRETRKLWIRAVQKVAGRWVFKDLEVETPGSHHRTRLHFDHVSFPGQGGAAADLD